MEIGVRGARITDVRATVLKAGDIRAHNTFEDPKAVEPVTVPIANTGAQLVYAFAPASVTRLEFTVA